jgi:hypothetical protein
MTMPRISPRNVNNNVPLCHPPYAIQNSLMIMKMMITMLLSPNDGLSPRLAIIERHRRSLRALKEAWCVGVLKGTYSTGSLVPAR